MVTKQFFKKKNLLFFVLIIPVVLVLVVAASCNGSAARDNTAVQTDEDSIALKNKKAWEAINKARPLLQDGELITRSDDDFESMTLQNFSKRDRSFSHSGMLFKEGNVFVVYHCMAGSENPDGMCRKDPYDSFVNPLVKTGFGLFKYDISLKEADSLHAIFKRNYAAKIPFDIYFNLKSNDSMYCSEMIYKSLKAATGNRIVLPTTSIQNFKPKIMGYKFNNAFFKTFEYVGIDDLYMNPFCKELVRVKY